MNKKKKNNILFKELLIKKVDVDNDNREIILSHKAAIAASPDEAICGEEDPGASLESLVTVDHNKERN